MIHGVMAEFTTSRRLIEATRAAHAAGYRKMDAYAPMPVEGLHEALGMPHTKINYLIGAAAVTGTILAFAMQYWISVVDYPLNVGGKPLASWPAWIIVAFEMTILFAGLGCLLFMLGANKLPQPYHPVFNVPRFERASQDRFFLCIEADDPMFDEVAVRQFLESLEPEEVSLVPR